MSIHAVRVDCAVTTEVVNCAAMKQGNEEMVFFKKRYFLCDLLDSDWRQRVQRIEECSRDCHLIPATSFEEANGTLSVRQRRVRASFPSNAELRSSLERLADELDAFSRHAIVHGDVNIKNLLFDGVSWRLVDLEPSLGQRKNGRETLMYTPPYIAGNDFRNDRLTPCTDKVGFYFFCRRMLRPIGNFAPRAEMRDIHKNGCVLQKYTGLSGAELAGIGFQDLLRLVASVGGTGIMR